MNVFIVIMSYFKIKNGNKISETKKWIDVGYRNRGDYAQMLSNLFPYTFKFRGKKMKSIEDFFQGIKFNDKKFQNYVFLKGFSHFHVEPLYCYLSGK